MAMIGFWYKKLRSWNSFWIRNIYSFISLQPSCLVRLKPPEKTFISKLLCFFFQSFSELEFQGRQGSGRVQQLVDILLRVMVETPGFTVSIFNKSMPGLENVCCIGTVTFYSCNTHPFKFFVCIVSCILKLQKGISIFKCSNKLINLPFYQ